MKIATLVLSLGLAASGIGLGAEARTDRITPPAARAEDGLAAIRGQVEAGVAQGRYSGAVFAIARPDRILDLEAVGVADVDTGAPMRPDSIFRLMSMTKPVTAAAVMILVDEGKLKLDDPVSRLLPEFGGFGVPGAPALTLRHLLTHSSGIGFGTIPKQPSSLEQRAREAATHKWPVPAGKQWAYSGIEGPDIIARAVEVAAGEPFEQFVKRRIFDPLGMKDTTWYLSPEQQKRLVGLYGSVNGKVVKMPPPLPLPDQPAGGYGLYSTAPDFLHFVQMLAGNGKFHGKRILSATAVAQLHAVQLEAGFPGLQPGLEWGLLMRRVGDPAAAGSPLPAGAYGWSGAYGTHFWIDPATGLAAVWMVNLTTAGGAASPDALAFERMVTAACRTDRRCRPN
jgi:CubicO group peptidase (beta-lactamase class C family)